MQRNIKRLFAYSTIAHMGFIALGIYVATDSGLSAALYYIVTYSLMSLGGFAMLLLLSKRGFDIERIDDLKGLNNRYPFYSFLFLLIILSMTGIPPLIGFYAKLLVLQSLVNSGHIFVATLAIFFSVIGAYYYLRVVKIMYFESADNAITIESRPMFALTLTINSLLLLLLGLLPTWLIDFCKLQLM